MKTHPGMTQVSSSGARNTGGSTLAAELIRRLPLTRGLIPRLFKSLNTAVLRERGLGKEPPPSHTDCNIPALLGENKGANALWSFSSHSTVEASGAELGPADARVSCFMGRRLVELYRR